MRRDLTALDGTFDLLVAGGGILGACVARDAALRGLRVALVDRADFGSGASSNSLKIIHGGLRYLQHLDLARVRESMAERSSWLRNAPHLVEPLPVVVPIARRGLRAAVPMRAGLALNDLLSWRRNAGVGNDRRIPSGRILGRAECAALAPALAPWSPEGALLFHDALMYSPERLVLEIVEAAADAGAVVVNYVGVEAALRRGRSIAGVRARDGVSGADFDIRARLVVNAAGGAAPELARRLLGRPARPLPPMALAMNLVFHAPGGEAAYAVPENRAGADGAARLLFAVPWRERLMVGTLYFPASAGPGGTAIHSAADVDRALAAINAAWRPVPFRAGQLATVHSGLLPAAAPAAAAAGSEQAPVLLERPLVVDHAADGGDGLITAIGVKYTTGRRLAERVVDRVCVRLGHRAAGRTSGVPLPGAGPSCALLLESARRRGGGILDDDVLAHLVRSYGARHDRVLDLALASAALRQRVVAGAPVIAAQLVHGAREEMAVRADDLLMRRTEIGPRGLVTEEARRLAETALRETLSPRQGFTSV